MQLRNLLEQLRGLAARLTLRQKIVTGATALAVLGGILWLVVASRDKDFAVLYSKLAAEDASQIVTRLKEGGVEYRLADDGSTIRVRSAMIPDLRLQMASAGIPKAGRIGYELFDRNNFGATEFAEQINFQRALEGELERTVQAISEVETARVHLTPAKDSVFTDQRRPAKASVLLKLKPARRLSKKNVEAVQRLLASAVDGLAPEQVSILDDQGNLLTLPAGVEPEEEILNQKLLAYRRNVERDLLAKLNATLEPLLGPERFRAAVSVDCDLTSAEQSEESYDPEKSVMTASQRSEDTGTTQQASGVPGVASNLPRPTSRPTLVGQGVTRKSESVNYQTSRFVKRTKMPQGIIRRISASVLVDHIGRIDGAGAKAKRLVEPPSAERLKSTRDLVAGAVGYNAERGDLVIVEAIPFEQTVAWQAAGTPGGDGGGTGVGWKGDPKLLLAAGAGALLLLLLAGIGMFLMRKRKAAAKIEVTLAAESKEVEAAAEAAVAAVEGRSGDEEEGSAARQSMAQIGDGEPSLEERFQKELAGRMAHKSKEETDTENAILAELASSVRPASATTKKTEVLTKHMADKARQDPGALAQIVRTWMSDAES
ncbi:MAG: flagellar basal-body MS-ring/collar protein FliF [Bryobacteraceae bacterium]